ncbi:MAG TPA: DNA polymerase III subunit gamma/tau [Candidatus Limnocylindrales bacterium]|nr:DNA polymerase III subunit gamma/tau [Candidatus Limnocylindrales bacterium]
MGKALYRKYRSKSLAEIIGQEHITDTLNNALKQGTISHAYLFTGPRGVGKTSIARILAHEVNGLPYNEEQPHLDIIEIDAASNRRIDEIRELRERVHVAPTSAKYKVYIIDEVHMLTKEAFNALLKTLEEPPDYVIFVLATTEAHKVPETIISRTQRFTFKPVAIDKVVDHLKYIAKTEKIKADDSALELIARHGEGSFRDSISLLDQVRHSSTHITLEHVRQALGQAPSTTLAAIIETVRGGDLPAIAARLGELREQGIQPTQIAQQLSEVLRQDILSQKPQLPHQLTLELLRQLASIPATSDPGISLELALYGSAITNLKTQVVEPSSPAITVPKKASAKPAAETTQPTAEPPKATHPELSPSKARSELKLNEENWQHVLLAVKAHHNTLYGITRMAVPSFEPGKLTLTFSFAFHQKRLKDSKNQQALVKIIKEVTGQSVTLDCLVDEKVGPKPQMSAAQPTLVDNIDLEVISNIFGNAEVVE